MSVQQTPAPEGPVDVARPPGFRRFFSTEAASAVVLLGAAVVAMIVANTPWGHAYEEFLAQPITIGFAGRDFDLSLHAFIDQGLMALFFLVIGLEIKRELIVGELSEARKALLPIIAAIGGMVVPALIYVSLNTSWPAFRGWAVPIATDIAFALGVVALFGASLPATLRVFLAALAIVDDIGAIIIICLFYSFSYGIDTSWLLGAAAVLALLVVLNRLGVDSPAPYLIVGFVLWVFVLKSGVQATIVGVLLAMVIPTKARIAPAEFAKRARTIAGDIEAADVPGAHVLEDSTQQLQAREISRSARYVAAPLQRIEFALQPWVAYGVLPLFALANAGVTVVGGSLSEGKVSGPVVIGVALGLLVGKPVGIALSTLIATKVSGARLPDGMTLRHVIAVGVLGGIGFTMSLLVANLAFPIGAPYATGAKLAVLGSSVVAGVAGSLLLALTVRRSEKAEQVT